MKIVEPTEDRELTSVEFLAVLRGVMHAKNPHLDPDTMLLIAARDFVIPESTEDANEAFRGIEAAWDETEEWNRRMWLIPDPIHERDF